MKDFPWKLSVTLPTEKGEETGMMKTRRVSNGCWIGKEPHIDQSIRDIDDDEDNLGWPHDFLSKPYTVERRRWGGHYQKFHVTVIQFSLQLSFHRHNHPSQGKHPDWISQRQFARVCSQWALKGRLSSALKHTVWGLIIWVPFLLTSFPHS